MQSDDSLTSCCFYFASRVQIDFLHTALSFSNNGTPDDDSKKSFSMLFIMNLIERFLGSPLQWISVEFNSLRILFILFSSFSPFKDFNKAHLNSDLWWFYKNGIFERRQFLSWAGRSSTEKKKKILGKGINNHIEQGERRKKYFCDKKKKLKWRDTQSVLSSC